MNDKKAKDQPVKSLTQSKIDRLPNGNIEIRITIPWETVSSEYKKTLARLAKLAKIKGFRPGKAPVKLVEKQLGKKTVYQEMVKDLMTDVYIEAFKTHKILPVVSPKISLVSSEEGKDWLVKAVTAELPKVELGDYKEAIRKTLAPEKIWVPGKDKKADKKETGAQDQRLQKIFEILLKQVKVKLPQILVEEEVNRMLSGLIDQTARLGMTVEQYLTSTGNTSEALRRQYQQQAENSLKLELVLSAIATQEKIQPNDQEVEKIIQATKDEKQRQALQTPTQKAYLRQILRKRQVIDSLLKL